MKRPNSVIRASSSVSAFLSVIFADGFGVKELGETAEPDGDTLFMIASNTKALRCWLAKRVEEHKMNWDTQVTTLYSLPDPDLTLGIFPVISSSAHDRQQTPMEPLILGRFAAREVAHVTLPSHRTDSNGFKNRVYG